MAHHKSALKRVRQTIKRTAQKRSQRADLRTVIRTQSTFSYGHLPLLHPTRLVQDDTCDSFDRKGFLVALVQALLSDNNNAYGG